MDSSISRTDYTAVKTPYWCVFTGIYHRILSLGRGFTTVFFRLGSQIRAQARDPRRLGRTGYGHVWDGLDMVTMDSYTQLAQLEYFYHCSVHYLLKELEAVIF